MAASTAEPPVCKIRTPASEASTWGEVTMPRYASVTGRPVSRKLAPAGGEPELHPQLGQRIAVVVRNLLEAVAPIQPDRRGQPPLAVEAEYAASERPRLLQHAVHEPPREPAPAAGRAQPHALQLDHAGFEPSHPGGAHYLTRGIHHD